MKFRSSFAVVVFSSASLLLAACAPGAADPSGDDDSPKADAAVGRPDAPPFIDAAVVNPVDSGPVQIGACDKIDILFVIDNSGSMLEEQTNLAANFPAFAQVIENYKNSAGKSLDYQLAITSTESGLFCIGDGEGKGGHFVAGNGCGFPAGRKYLKRGDANVGSAFSCAAKLGTGGSSTEVPLEASKCALVDRMTGTPAPNAGFLRQDALLAIVYLTDEDDHSPEFDPTVYAPKLDAVKDGKRGRWATAVIAGPGPGKCTSAFGSAAEATRLKSFVSAVGTNAVFASICDGDLAGSLTKAFDKFSAACEHIPPIE